MADIDDNPEDLMLAEAISYLAFGLLLTKDELAARQVAHSEPLDEEQKALLIKIEEKPDRVHSRKTVRMAFTPDDAAKIDAAKKRLAMLMIDERVPGTGHPTINPGIGNSSIGDERENIPPAFMRRGVCIEPLWESISDNISLPGRFGSTLRGYRYVQINRAELKAAAEGGQPSLDGKVVPAQDEPPAQPERRTETQAPPPVPTLSGGGYIPPGRPKLIPNGYMFFLDALDLAESPEQVWGWLEAGNFAAFELSRDGKLLEVLLRYWRVDSFWDRARRTGYVADSVVRESPLYIKEADLKLALNHDQGAPDKPLVQSEGGETIVEQIQIGNLSFDQEPRKPLKDWLGAKGLSGGADHKHDYLELNRRLDGVWSEFGDEYLFEKLGSIASIAKKLRDNLIKAGVQVPAGSVLRDFVTAWAYDKALSAKPAVK